MYCRFQFLRIFIKQPMPLLVQPVQAQLQRQQCGNQLQLLRNRSLFQAPKLINCPLFRRRLTNNSSSPQSNTPKNQEGGQAKPKLNIWAKFKIMYKDYWYVLVPVHLSTSACWLGGFYYLTKSGVDLGYYMKKVGFSESLVNKANSGVGHLAVAYALYKVATPARIAVTLGCTTFSINVLKNMGYIKPAREIYNKGRGRFQTLSQQMKDQKK